MVKSNRFLLAQEAGFFLLLHSFQANVGFIDSNQAPELVEIHFPGAAPRASWGGSRDGLFCSKQAANPQEARRPCPQQGWGTEGAVLVVERPPAGGEAGAKGVSPESGHIACSQRGPAPPALQAVGCPAPPGTGRGPRRSPPVLRTPV